MALKHELAPELPVVVAPPAAARLSVNPAIRSAAQWMVTGVGVLAIPLVVRGHNMELVPALLAEEVVLGPPAKAVTTEAVLIRFRLVQGGLRARYRAAMERNLKHVTMPAQAKALFQITPRVTPDAVPLMVDGETGLHGARVLIMVPVPGFKDALVPAIVPRLPAGGQIVLDLPLSFKAVCHAVAAKEEPSVQHPDARAVPIN